MAGSHDGGVKAAKTNKSNYGNDFYRRIGATGGRNGHTGGFHNNPELARRAGTLGGKKSRRGVKENIMEDRFVDEDEKDERLWEMYVIECENRGDKPKMKDYLIWLDERSE